MSTLRNSLIDSGPLLWKAQRESHYEKKMGSPAESSKAEKQRPEGIRSSSHPLPLLTLFLRYAIEVVVVEADEAG